MKTVLRILRIKKGLSQAALAERIGTYQKRIRRFERGEKTPKAEEMQKLQEILLDEPK